MIFIVVKFTVQEEFASEWLARTKAFTDATRGEEGNLWFEWSVSVDVPNEFVLVEAFSGPEAGAAHVASQHFRDGLDAMRPMLSRTPQIINTVVDQYNWSNMGELEVSHGQSAL